MRGGEAEIGMHVLAVMGVEMIIFLQNVPAPAWGLAGALVGVLGTLGATLLSNGSNDKRFAQQLQHDADQKAKDRAVETRRGVYLEAVEKLVAVGTFFGQLAVRDPTNIDEMSVEMTQFLAATSKVSLIAGERTRQKVSELSGVYSSLFIELMSDASEAHRLAIDIGVNRDSYERLKDERSRLLSAIKDANENSESKYRFESLSKSFDSTVKPMGEVSEEFSRLNQQRSVALEKYAASTTQKMSEMIELQAEALALLREEFDVDVDVDQMKVQFRSQSERSRTAAAALFEKLRNLGSRE